AEGGAGDDGKNGHTRGLVRGGLPEGRIVAYRIGHARRTRFEGNHRLSRAWRDGEAVVVRLVRGAQERPKNRAQSEDRQGSADFAAARDGVQAVRDPQAAHQRRFRRTKIASFTAEGSKAAVDKAPDAFRTISEVAEQLDLPQHVLPFWENRFRHIT